MATVTLRATGSAPVDLAWERYAVLARWPQWSPQIRGVEAADERIRPGLEGTVAGYFGLRVRFVVDAVDETSHTWAWTVASGPVRLRLRHEVGARADGTAGSSTVLVVSGPAPVVLAYLAPARLALGRLVAGLSVADPA